MRLLDTDVLIDIQRGHVGALAWFGSLTEMPVIPGFVFMELIQSAKNLAQIHQVYKLTAPLKIVWPSESHCQLALTIFSTYHLTRGIGLLDALIAATAIERGGTLCTFNTKHFHFVPSLVTEQPYTR